MELQGQSLILTVSVLTSLGFMLIGYDNGLMGGLVNTTAFKDTFDSPDSDMIGVIVAIYESKFYFPNGLCWSLTVVSRMFLWCCFLFHLG
jgi:hypothetical protein